MPEGARIYSTEAIGYFRAALIKFAESGNSALTSADSDIERVIGWLERDQTTFWAGQVRKRHDRVLQLEDAVRQKRLYKDIDGTTKSAVDEIKMLQHAKRAEDEAVQKTVTVRKALQHLRKESMMFKGRVQRLATSLQSDIPTAIHSLDTMMDHIEAYLAVQTAGEGRNFGDSAEQISRAASSEKVGLERLRDQTPKPDQRDSAAFTLVGSDHPMHQPWKAGLMQDWQIKVLAGLGVDRELARPRVRGSSASRCLDQRQNLSRADASHFRAGFGLVHRPRNRHSRNRHFRTGRCAGVSCGSPGGHRAGKEGFVELLGMPASTLIVLDAGGPTAMFDQLGLDIWALALIKAAEPPAAEPPADAVKPNAETAGK